jgi:hypothetical protein
MATCTVQCILASMIIHLYSCVVVASGELFVLLLTRQP